MTSREHARRLMLILLASEGTALRQAADERGLRRRELGRPTRTGGPGIRAQGELHSRLHRFGADAPRSSEAMS